MVGRILFTQHADLRAGQLVRVVRVRGETVIVKRLGSEVEYDVPGGEIEVAETLRLR